LSEENQPDSTIEKLPEARIMVIGKSQYNISQVTEFLSDSGYQTKGMYSLTEAITKITAFKPTHVFISIAFGNNKVNRLAQTCKDTMGTNFYVFPEDINNEIEAEIRSSKVENKMHVNITGGGVIRIIEKWLNEQFAEIPEEFRKKRKRRKKSRKSRKNNGQTSDKAGQVNVLATREQNFGSTYSTMEVDDEIGSVMVLGRKPSNEPGIVNYIRDPEPEASIIQHKEKPKALKGHNIGFVTVACEKFEGYAIFCTKFRTPLRPEELNELTDELTAAFQSYRASNNLAAPKHPVLRLTNLDISEETERFAEDFAVDKEVKFIEGLDSAPLIDKSDEPNMIAVDLQRIETHLPVDFDVYIRLTINKKYVKYVNSGSRLGSKQKEKLLQSNTKKVHIKKEDQHKFEKYCVYAFVMNALKKAG